MKSMGWRRRRVGWRSNGAGWPGTGAAMLIRPQLLPRKCTQPRDSRQLTEYISQIFPKGVLENVGSTNASHDTIQHLSKSMMPSPSHAMLTSNSGKWICGIYSVQTSPVRTISQGTATTQLCKEGSGGNGRTWNFCSSSICEDLRNLFRQQSPDMA